MFQVGEIKMDRVKNIRTTTPLNLKLALIPALLCCPAYPTWSNASTTKTTLTVDFKQNRYYVNNIIRINASPETVINSLTNYPNLKHIIPSVSNSRLLEAHSDYDLVETDLYNCVLLFCKKLINVQQIMIADNTVTALTIPDKSDFKYALMTWEVEEDAGMTTVKYHAEIELKFWIPPLIGPSILKHKLKRETALVTKALENI